MGRRGGGRAPPAGVSPPPPRSEELWAGGGPGWYTVAAPGLQATRTPPSDEIVLHALDEAGMRLRMLVARLRLHQLAGLEVDVEVALARPIDAIGPVQAGVEPLRGVRRDELAGQHEAQLVMERGRILFGGKI